MSLKRPARPYGSNPAAGRTFVGDSVTLHDEVYGQGEPLLVIHGNGGSIGTMAAAKKEAEPACGG